MRETGSQHMVVLIHETILGSSDGVSHSDTSTHAHRGSYSRVYRVGNKVSSIAVLHTYSVFQQLTTMALRDTTKRTIQFPIHISITVNLSFITTYCVLLSGVRQAQTICNSLSIFSAPCYLNSSVDSLTVGIYKRLVNKLGRLVGHLVVAITIV